MDHDLGLGSAELMTILATTGDYGNDKDDDEQ
jgi:hypothetical protein